MKIIDGDALKGEFSKRLWFVSSPQAEAQAIIDIIDNAPEVEPAKWQYEFFMKLFEKARPKGEWVDINGDGSLWKCTNCNEKSCCKGKFCPDCGAKMKSEESKRMTKINYEKIDNDEIKKSVHLLDLFTKTFCRYTNDYERFNDLKFRCDECPFSSTNGDCQVKKFKSKYYPDYKDFGSMGDL